MCLRKCDKNQENVCMNVLNQWLILHTSILCIHKKFSSYLWQFFLNFDNIGIWFYTFLGADLNSPLFQFANHGTQFFVNIFHLFVGGHVIFVQQHREVFHETICSNFLKLSSCIFSTIRLTHHFLLFKTWNNESSVCNFTWKSKIIITKNI